MHATSLIKHFVPWSVRRYVRERIQRSEQRRRMGLTRIQQKTRGQWSIDAITVADDGMSLEGWALAPDGDHAAVAFTINDQEVDEVDYPLPRPDVAKVFWYAAHARRSGFCCRLRSTRRELFPEGFATLQCIERATRQPLNEELTYCLQDPQLDDQPLPEPWRRERVHGNASESAFRILGATAFCKLQRALERTVGKSYRDCARILDWGCGSGRVTRYFHGVPTAALTGIDVDADNIDWCRQNLRWGRYAAIPLHPPTALESQSFDLLIGISIFTHLREHEQFEWLAELNRLAAPGALLLMTVHGETAAFQADMIPVHWDAWKASGFLDRGRDPRFDGVLEEAEYYRTSFHTRDYIEKRWSPYFEVVDLLPGYIAYQDLVVLRKP